MDISPDLKAFATERQAQIIDAVLNSESLAAAARSLGISTSTIYKTIERPQQKQSGEDPAITEAVRAGGLKDSRHLSHFWKIVKDENGTGYSLFIKNPRTGDKIAVTDLVREAIDEAQITPPLDLAPRHSPSGEHLLVIDLADVHFLKLAVKTETGYEYNRNVARHRVIEGTKALLRAAEPWGIGQILFVLGNDILHTDNPRSTTTSGTFQDTDGTLFQGFCDASLALREAIDAAAEVTNVDLLHCMSNHDWIMGWTLSQTISAHYRAASGGRVRATDYNLAESHRKYYRFGNNLLGFAHGDGTKEENLYALMVHEARQHISQCPNLYWYLHHVHHKITKKRGQFVHVKEKDHIGMTAVISGTPAVEGSHINIEYVRSPSAPDGWHDRNGYVNRQAVECFIHHPHLGARARFTEWF